MAPLGQIIGRMPMQTGQASRGINSQLSALNYQPSANIMATIEARGLRKTFGTTVALDGVDLRVEEGRILGIIGPNGAGKTTALNAILGLTSYRGNIVRPRTRSLELTRGSHARCLVYC